MRVKFSLGKERTMGAAMQGRTKGRAGLNSTDKEGNKKGISGFIGKNMKVGSHNMKGKIESKGGKVGSRCPIIRRKEKEKNRKRRGKREIKKTCKN